MIQLWTLPTLYFFLISLAVVAPFFIYGIISNRKNVNDPDLLFKRTVFPLKIIGGLLLLEIVKLIWNINSSSISGALPFYFSDLAIYTLVCFVFSKKDTSFNKLSYLAALCLGMLTICSFLVAPYFIVYFEGLSKEGYEPTYNTVHGLITHFAICYSFIWLALWRIVKLEKKDLLNIFYLAGTFTIFVMSFSFIFRCNYNWCLQSPLTDKALIGFHPDRTYIEPIYAFCLWMPLSLALQVGCGAILVFTDKFKIGYQWKKNERVEIG